MGNKISSPFPTYEHALTHLNPMELNQLKRTFKVISQNHGTINLNNFTQVFLCSFVSLACFSVYYE